MTLTFIPGLRLTLKAEHLQSLCHEFLSSGNLACFWNMVWLRFTVIPRRPLPVSDMEGYAPVMLECAQMFMNGFCSDMLGTIWLSWNVLIYVWTECFSSSFGTIWMALAFIQGHSGFKQTKLMCLSGKSGNFGLFPAFAFPVVLYVSFHVAPLRSHWSKIVGKGSGGGGMGDEEGGERDREREREHHGLIYFVFL